MDEENKTKGTNHDIEEITLFSLYDKFGWSLYEKFEHAYDAFRLIMNAPEEVFNSIDINEVEKEALVESIKKRMAPQPLKIRADFKMNCPNKEGIYALRQAIRECKKAINNENFYAEVLIDAPPKYKIEVVQFEKQKAIAKLEQGLRVIKKFITEKGGGFELETEPFVIGGNQDKDIEDIKAGFQLQDRGDNNTSQEEEEEEGIGIADDDEEDML